MRRLLLMMILSATAPMTWANTSHFTISTTCRTAYGELLQMQLQSATKRLDADAAADGRNVAPLYFINQVDFIRAFVSEEESDFNKMQQSADRCLELLEHLDATNPWKKFAHTEVLLRSAVVKLKRKEFLTAGNNIRKAFGMVMEVRKSHPHFAPALKTAGLLHAIVGTVPENYKWLANLAGMQGTIQQGVSELESALVVLKKDAGLGFLYDEALLYRVLCASHFEKNEAKAVQLMEQRAKTTTPQGLFLFFHVNSLVKTERYADALRMINAYNPGTAAYPLHYLQFQKGMILLGGLQTKEAAQAFGSYVRMFKGNSFVKASWQKMAWIHLLNGDVETYRKHMLRIKSVGSDFTDEDKQAQLQAESGDVPNVPLLECRLLFDGGNYDKALEKLSAIPTRKLGTVRDNLEYTYRMARICEKKNLTDLAVKYYTATYENGKSQQWYFAANSALLLGGMYEKKGDNRTALSWYRKCLALRNHEYQNSIDQKAEAGKNRLQ
jgi:tetratricopeptide (TPR) repeat protein